MENDFGKTIIGISGLSLVRIMQAVLYVTDTDTNTAQ